MCTQALAPGYTLCMQAPVANFKTPDWLRTGANQAGTGAWVHKCVPRRRRLGTHFGSLSTECYPSDLYYTMAS